MLGVFVASENVEGDHCKFGRVCDCSVVLFVGQRSTLDCLKMLIKQVAVFVLVKCGVMVGGS